MFSLPLSLFIRLAARYTGEKKQEGRKRGGGERKRERKIERQREQRVVQQVEICARVPAIVLRNSGLRRLQYDDCFKGCRHRTVSHLLHLSPLLPLCPRAHIYQFRVPAVIPKTIKFVINVTNARARARRSAPRNNIVIGRENIIPRRLYSLQHAATSNKKTSENVERSVRRPNVVALKLVPREKNNQVIDLLEWNLRRKLYDRKKSTLSSAEFAEN